MIEPTLVTIALFPAYMLLRYAFFYLPLHMDTGFYVSNHTICRRRFDFSKGWNAAFAGCSKALPELFYSLVYLAHGGSRYKQRSRQYFALYNYLTAVTVGWTAAVLGGSVLYYYAALVAYCLVSSEPHYGVYFESAEQFEVLFEALAVEALTHDFPLPVEREGRCDSERRAR